MKELLLLAGLGYFLFGKKNGSPPVASTPPVQQIPQLNFSNVIPNSPVVNRTPTGSGLNLQDLAKPVGIVAAGGAAVLPELGGSLGAAAGGFLPTTEIAPLALSNALVPETLAPVTLVAPAAPIVAPEAAVLASPAGGSALAGLGELATAGITLGAAAALTEGFILLGNAVLPSAQQSYGPGYSNATGDVVDPGAVTQNLIAQGILKAGGGSGGNVLYDANYQKAGSQQQQ